MQADGGEPVQVTSLEHGVSEHDWAPDSRHLVVVSPADMKPETAETSADVRVITSAYYKFNGHGFVDHRYPQLFVIDRKGHHEPSRQLTSGRFMHHSASWSPNGGAIAFVAN
jgi:dipeptidyl aminopeptidase/acylaminoacyl peptidase